MKQDDDAVVTHCSVRLYRLRHRKAYSCRWTFENCITRVFRPEEIASKRVEIAEGSNLQGRDRKWGPIRVEKCCGFQEADKGEKQFASVKLQLVVDPCQRLYNGVRYGHDVVCAIVQ